MTDFEVRARWTGREFVPVTNRREALDKIQINETVLISVERSRSMASHRHAFAWINDAWASLPEALAEMPWAETPETLRKHALIACGYSQSYTLDCGARTTAHRVKAALVAAEAGKHGYAIGQVRGPVVTIWTPESQSMRAMGGKKFNESKAAILNWIADKIGVAPEELVRT